MTESIGIIVGSGFESLGLEIAARSPTKTPYGEPSSPVLTLQIGEQRVACIARHGERHGLAPHEINYRANLWALHERGVRTCIGVNAVGAIAPGFAPGDLALPDQLIDYTWGRAGTFGSDGRVVHVDFTEPFDPVLRGRLAAAVAHCGLEVRAGTYGVTQGPRLETAAEIDRLERDGCAMVGMTALPEAALARELGWAYAICAVAVNYAAGRSPGGVPIVAEIAASLASGMRRVAEVVRRVTPSLAGDAM
ncbi:MAG TPA: S-methyl-5'-thioinosine phosphorylase [Gammaproteobacteria bacterium]|nr:S-methyl-5'-thioinosine phosphorylase [Gammaproteobacteria bacterium]